ncbi:hypothetical protein [Streptomyces sp. NPDC003635]
MPRWADNSVPPSDVEIMRRELDDLRPLFERFPRAPGGAEDPRSGLRAVPGWGLGVT